MRRLWLALLLSGCTPPDNPFLDGDAGTGGGSAAQGGGTAAIGGGSASNGGGGGSTSSLGGGTSSVGGGTASSGGGTSASGGGAGGGSGGCTESWTCSGWQLAAGGTTATRTCVDVMGCGTTTMKPDEGPAQVPALDTNYYRCSVQPLMDATCSMMGCHGTDSGRDLKVYARGRWRHNETVPQSPTCLSPGAPMNLQQEGSGTIMCLGWSRLTRTEWQMNYDSARLFMVDVANSDDSLLLTEPLSGSSFAHDGIKVFTGTDARYTTLKAWLDGATAPATCDGGMN